MLQTILRYFSLSFPHTSARLAYWRFILLYDDTGLLDPRNAVIALLPTCIYFLEIFLEDRPRTSGILNNCIVYGLFMHVIFDVVVALDLVLRASGSWSKILLAVDLLVESSLVLLASLIVFLSVGLFVTAALEGFPFARDLFLSIVCWMLVVFFEILGFEEPIEVDLEEDEAIAGDPFRDE